MDIGQLTILAGVARTGSFSAYARSQGVDPSSVSRAIASLETELGLTLFERTTRRLALTESGRVYLDRIRPLIDEIAAASDAARDTMTEPAGQLSVTTSVAFGERWLVPRIASFRHAYPKIQLNLHLNDAVVDIAAEGIDLAIRLGASVEGALVASKLFDTQYRVVASPAYLERFGKPGEPDDLHRHDGVFFALPGVPERWSFKKRTGGPTLEAAPKVGLSVSNALAIRRAALEGVGVAMLADWTVRDDLESGALADMFPAYECGLSGFDTAVWLVYANRSYVPARLRVFMDSLKHSTRRATDKTGSDRAF